MSDAAVLAQQAVRVSCADVCALPTAPIWRISAANSLGEKDVAISIDRPAVASVSASMRHRLGSSSNTSDSRPPTLTRHAVPP